MPLGRGILVGALLLGTLARPVWPALCGSFSPNGHERLYGLSAPEGMADLRVEGTFYPNGSGGIRVGFVIRIDEGEYGRIRESGAPLPDPFDPDKIPQGSILFLRLGESTDQAVRFERTTEGVRVSPGRLDERIHFQPAPGAEARMVDLSNEDNRARYKEFVLSLWPASEEPEIPRFVSTHPDREDRAKKSTPPIEAPPRDDWKWPARSLREGPMESSPADVPAPYAEASSRNEPKPPAPSCTPWDIGCHARGAMQAVADLNRRIHNVKEALGDGLVVLGQQMARPAELHAQAADCVQNYAWCKEMGLAVGFGVKGADIISGTVGFFVSALGHAIRPTFKLGPNNPEEVERNNQAADAADEASKEATGGAYGAGELGAELASFVLTGGIGATLGLARGAAALSKAIPRLVQEAPQLTRSALSSRTGAIWTREELERFGNPAIERAMARLAEIEKIREQKGLAALTEEGRRRIFATRLYRELNPIQGEQGRRLGQGGLVVADTTEGVLPSFASNKGLSRGVVFDHHGAHFDPLHPEVDSSMKVLGEVEEWIAQNGVSAKSLEGLGRRFERVYTDNLGDGLWSAWIARNIGRVASDPALRDRIRMATDYEDFGFFGRKALAQAQGDAAKAEAIELQHAAFNGYDALLKRYGLNSDRFGSLPKPQQQQILEGALGHLDRILDDAVFRKAQAAEFGRSLEQARKAAEAARLPIAPEFADALSHITVIDAGALAKQGVFAAWGGAAQANGKPLLLSFKSLAPIGERIRQANLAKAAALGIDEKSAGSVFGRDGLQVAFPPGLTLTPDEVMAAIAGRSKSLSHDWVQGVIGNYSGKLVRPLNDEGIRRVTVKLGVNKDRMIGLKDKIGLQGHEGTCARYTIACNLNLQGRDSVDGEVVKDYAFEMMDLEIARGIQGRLTDGMRVAIEKSQHRERQLTNLGASKMHEKVVRQIAAERKFRKSVLNQVGMDSNDQRILGDRLRFDVMPLGQVSRDADFVASEAQLKRAIEEVLGEGRPVEATVFVEDFDAPHAVTVLAKAVDEQGRELAVLYDSNQGVVSMPWREFHPVEAFKIIPK